MTDIHGAFELYLDQHRELYQRLFRRIMNRRYGRSEVRLFIVEGMSVQECCRSIFKRRFCERKGISDERIRHCRKEAQIRYPDGQRRRILRDGRVAKAWI